MLAPASIKSFFRFAKAMPICSDDWAFMRPEAGSTPVMLDENSMPPTRTSVPAGLPPGVESTVTLRFFIVPP